MAFAIPLKEVVGIMQNLTIAAALVSLAAALPVAQAQAAGCLKGAAVGGIAGHYAGQHGWLGAGVGCLVGRHEANKRMREQAVQDRSYNRY